MTSVTPTVAQRLLGLTLVATIALSGCSPVHKVGITVTPDGVPEVLNCGGYLYGVEVRDATSDRVIWSAAITPNTTDYGEDQVHLGLLPNRNWEEHSALLLTPRPQTWEFAIRIDSGQPEIVVLADADLTPGRVYVPSTGHQVSESAFSSDVCGNFSLPHWMWLIIVIPVTWGVGFHFVERWRGWRTRPNKV